MTYNPRVKNLENAVLQISASAVTGTTATFASITGTLVGTASYATTAANANTVTNGVYTNTTNTLTGVNTFNTAYITASAGITGSDARFTSVTGSALSAGSSSQFAVNTSGNITKINNVTTNFPSSQGGASTVLTNDGAGNLSWSAAGSSITTYSSSIGNGSATSFAVTHSLNKTNIMIAVREYTTGSYVYPDIDYTSANVVTLTFATAPSSSQYLVSILGF